MSWKYKVTILYLGFVAVILTGVIAASMQDFQLVRPDYYEAEIAYQDRINEIQNVAKLSIKPKVRQTEKSIQLDFPMDLAEASGTVRFYRPSDASLDRSLGLALENAQQEISTTELRPGRWKLQLDYELEGKRYYQEQELLIY